MDDTKTHENHRYFVFYSQMKALDYGLLADALDLETVANSATVDVKGGKILLQDVIINAVEKHLNESLQKIDDKKLTKKSSTGKNVTELRNKLIKDFIRDKLNYKGKNCIHCGSPRRNVRIEYNSKIYLKALSSRQASSWESVARLHTSNQNTQSSDVTKLPVLSEDLSNVGFNEEGYSGEEDNGKVLFQIHYFVMLLLTCTAWSYFVEASLPFNFKFDFLLFMDVNE